MSTSGVWRERSVASLGDKRATRARFTGRRYRAHPSEERVSTER